jgi:hypothetical protein
VIYLCTYDLGKNNLAKEIIMSSAIARSAYTDRNTWNQVYYNGVIPEGMELIQDSRPLQIVEQKLLNESRNGRQQDILRLTGVFQRADELNANGRIYPIDVLKEAVESMQDALQNRRVMGEFDHPPDAKIHLDRISHLVSRLWMENNVVYGELEVINDTRVPHGAALAALIEHKVQVGISSRGVGDMESTRLAEGDEAFEVQPGFAFVTFDAVAEPSVSGTQLMVMESRNRNLRRSGSNRKALEKSLVEEFRRGLKL